MDAFLEIICLLLLYEAKGAISQDYEVSDIRCTFWSEGRSAKGPLSLTSSQAGVSVGGMKDMLSARVRKPEGFKGSPLYMDDRSVDPLVDPVCQIRPDLTDVNRLTYNILITDFSRCGVLRRNGYITVRVWFPQFPGVVMMSDQELIIMCKPPEPTIIENKAAGFAGSFPNGGARVSGVVEETPSKLEYEVALYKEAPTRLSNLTNSELPVDQAVPIGTKLQLRARINPSSAWKFVKLMEVTVSPDPDDPHVLGSVPLVKDGCRNRDFASIIPHQPARYRDRHNEVFLDFEAFLLSTMKERSTLWIHSQIKACMDAADCQPEYCLDLFEPSGHGRRRRELRSSDSRIINSSHGGYNNDTNSEFGEDHTKNYTKNIEYSVLIPADMYHQPIMTESTCHPMVVTSGVLGCLLLLSAFIMSYLAIRLQSTLTSKYNQNSMDQMARERSRKLSLGHFGIPGYTGRATLQ